MKTYTLIAIGVLVLVLVLAPGPRGNVTVEEPTITVRRTAAAPTVQSYSEDDPLPPSDEGTATPTGYGDDILPLED